VIGNYSWPETANGTRSVSLYGFDTDPNRLPLHEMAGSPDIALGHLRLKFCDRQMAREAFARAADVVGQIEVNVRNEKLRATFLNSAAVREVLEGSKNLRLLARLDHCQRSRFGTFRRRAIIR
jgi:hypothetical protein